MHAYLDSMVEIVDVGDELQRRLFDEFNGMCETEFPDPNQRESGQQWIERLLKSGVLGTYPKTNIILKVCWSATSSKRSVVGGIVFEYFKVSLCGMITYLVVSPMHRRRGIARKLLNASTTVLRQEAEARGGTLLAVFGESNDPRKVSPEADRMSPEVRLPILARLGAKWIDIPYVQPALAEEKQRVRDLLLLVFPDLLGSGAPLRRAVLITFLEELYRYLGVEEPWADMDFRNMVEPLSQNHVPVEPLPFV